MLGESLPSAIVDSRGIVIEGGEVGLVEQAWLGQTLIMGHQLRIQVTVQTERCVMISNPQVVSQLEL